MSTWIEKTLSANDTGETGGHQAGILVPKLPEILGFFPYLDPGIKNPRSILDMVDDIGHEWTFNYIYYNNKLSGGTRNEYRITGMTKFFHEFDIRAGCTLIFKKISFGSYRITYRRILSDQKVIKLSDVWKIIDVD